jgi:U6 snRNA-associated Sm-like protein LSm2
MFKTLIGKPVTVHLKNDTQITGTLSSVDQYLNFKLLDIDTANHPTLAGVTHCFIRGSVVRYVELLSAAGAIDPVLLQDATRKEIAYQCSRK